jgi:hypothetical protein
VCIVIRRLCLVACGVRDKIKNSTSVSSIDVVKGDLRINSNTPEIDCDQTAMGLPPVTSAVLLMAK